MTDDLKKIVYHRPPDMDVIACHVTLPDGKVLTGMVSGLEMASGNMSDGDIKSLAYSRALSGDCHV